MLTGLEALAKVKERLLEEGKYVPMVKKGSVEASNRRGVDLNEMGLLEEGGCIDDCTMSRATLQFLWRGRP
jgi:hypothetical protein